MLRTPLAALATLALVVSAAAVACSSDDPAAGGDAGGGPEGDGGGAADGGPGGSDGAAPGEGGAPFDAGDDATIVTDGDVGAPLTVTSAAFADGQPLPVKHSCGPTSANPHVSPPLAWTGGQAGAASYAVVMRDQTLNDAFHWVIWDIPAATTSLPENVARVAAPAAPAGAKQAVVGFSAQFGDGAPGYFYACPPEADGAHTYTFTVYAMPMATLPNVTPASTPDEVVAELGADAMDIGRVSATLDR